MFLQVARRFALLPYSSIWKERLVNLRYDFASASGNEIQDRVDFPRRSHLKRALIAAGLAVLVVGCGGGGGTGSAGPNLVSLFISDSMDQNDHVWVTVKSVDLVGSGGNTNVFS